MNSLKSSLLAMVLLSLLFFAEKDPALKRRDLSAMDIIPGSAQVSVLLSSPRLGEDSVLACRKLLLFVIDSDDFMCMSCLDSFLDFCLSFPQSILEKHAWGILILSDETDGEGENYGIAIAEKKLRGLMKGSQITFPFLIDKSGFFESFLSGGSSVVVFDEENRSVSRFIFPLDREEVLQIQRSLLRN